MHAITLAFIDFFLIQPFDHQPVGLIIKDKNVKVRIHKIQRV